MRNFFLALLLIGHFWMGPAGAQTPVPTSSSAAATLLTSLFNNYWDDRARLFPLLATAQGDNRYNDRLPNDQTRVFRQQQARRYRR